jgi:hypothetical protein
MEISGTKTYDKFNVRKARGGNTIRFVATLISLLDWVWFRDPKKKKRFFLASSILIVSTIKLTKNVNFS